MSGTEQASLATRWRSECGLARSGSLTQLWQWLAGSAQADLERTFFEGRDWSLKRGHKSRTGSGLDSAGEWLTLIACLLDHQPMASSPGRHAAVPSGGCAAASEDEQRDGAGHDARQAAATLVFAILRGLLLDLLTTGDDVRVQSAFDLFGRALDAVIAFSGP